MFFFFKQKTADEMRISDWSSDVCSSDLSLEDFRKEMTAKHEADTKKAATDNQAKADAFLKENAGKDGVKTLADGIQYIVEKSGDPKGDRSDERRVGKACVGQGSLWWSTYH